MANELDIKKPYTKEEARDQFWADIGEHAPRVTRNLSDRVLPTWLNFREHADRLPAEMSLHHRTFGHLHAVVRGPSHDLPTDLVEAILLTNRALIDWGRRHFIFEPWMIRRAENTMYEWSQNPELRETRQWTKISRPGMQRLVLNTGIPPDDDQGKLAHKQRLMKTFESLLDVWLEADAIPTRPEILFPGDPVGFKRVFFIRLVHFQCLEKNRHEVARDLGCDPTTIRTSVIKLAKFLDLELRESPIGRHQGSRNLHP